MKTYRETQGELFILGPCNFNREDERVLFHNILKSLGDHQGITLEKVRQLPYCDIVDGYCEKGDFFVSLDLNDGCEIKSKNSDVLDFLEKLLH